MTNAEHGDSLAAPFAIPAFTPPQFPDHAFNIRDFGATEGGAAKSTAQIQSAIDKCSGSGGGSVIIPQGIWLTGGLKFRSNVNLHLEKGAELRFSQDRADYLPVVFSRHEDIECYKYAAFLYADSQTNIAITGEGVLNGQGKPWWPLKDKGLEARLYEMGNTGVPVLQRVFDGKDGMELRPAFFQPMNCSNILVEGVTFRYGAFWTITPTYCSNVIVRNVHIVTEGDYGHTPNGDGVDPSSCRNVLIENCEFDTGDDCIAIKSGRDADGLRVGKPTENVIVRNCRGYRGHGGIVIGSESSGDVRNIYGAHCTFTGTDRLVRIKTARGRGGVIENCWFDDISGSEIKYEAIHVNMLYTGTRLPEQPVTASTPAIRNLHFSNIRCASGKTYGLEILGLPERPVEGCWFDSIVTSTNKGFHLSDVKGVHITNSTVTTPAVPPVLITDGVDVTAENLVITGSAENKLRVDGAHSRNITFRKSTIQKAGNTVILGSDVPRDAVLIEE